MRPQTDFPESYLDFPHDECDSFEYHRKYPPDYSYWGKMPIWSIDEAVHLIHGVNPEFYKNLSKHDPIDNAEEEILKTKRLLERDILAENIRPKGRTRGRIIHLISSDVVNWALSREIEVPEELLSFLKNNKKDVDKSNSIQKPPYLDANHKYHSEELKIAIETWMALFENKKYISKKEALQHPQFKRDIKKHIEEHYKIKSAREIERITTVLNPKNVAVHNQLINHLG